MDRIALAKRLESLSSVFASHTPYNRDLRAMSYVLSKMADDKFTSILSGDFSPDELEACMCGAGPGAGPMPKIVPVGGPVDEPEGLPGEPKVIVIEKEEGVPMSAEANEKTAGMFWCKEASKAIVDNLLRDVVGMNKSQCCSTGAKLDAKQVPNGSHDGEKAPTLKPEQTPDDAASIKTNMVEKSHGAVKKEATEKEASLEDIKNKKEEDEKKKMKKDVEELKKEKAEKKASEEGEDEKSEQKAEDKEKKAIKMLNEAEKEEEKAEEGEKDATTESSSSSFEGIELVASMEEVELDAAEADQLSKLFE